jgi:hypothetical protein
VTNALDSGGRAFIDFAGLTIRRLGLRSFYDTRSVAYDTSLEFAKACWASAGRPALPPADQRTRTRVLDLAAAAAVDACPRLRLLRAANCKRTVRDQLAPPREEGEVPFPCVLFATHLLQRIGTALASSPTATAHACECGYLATSAVALADHLVGCGSRPGFNA